jgi:F0F1-type ATP synthase epsilon subunit
LTFLTSNIQRQSEVQKLSATDQKSKSKPAKLKLHVKVYSPYKTYFDEEAYSVSAVNGTGPFDILPKHHNFMTLLKPCEVTIAREDGPIKIRIARGVMHVKADRAVIFLDV